MCDRRLLLSLSAAVREAWRYAIVPVEPVPAASRTMAVRNRHH